MVINWKTTLAAVLAALPQVLGLLNVLDPVLANKISIILIALGLLHAKDNNVTGGTVAQDGGTLKDPSQLS